MPAITIKPPSEIDVSAFTRWYADPEVNQYLEGRLVEPLPEAYYAAWRASLDPERSFAVYSGRRFVGVTWAMPATPHFAVHQVLALTVLILDKRMWGRGIGTHAAIQTVRACPCRVWMGTTYGSNVRMQRVFMNAGFNFAGEIPSFYEFEDGYTSYQMWHRHGSLVT